MENFDAKSAAKKLDELMPRIAKNFHGMETEDHDITIQQFIVLKAVHENENSKMSDLSNELGVSLGNMTGMVDRLIKGGLVERFDDPADRRIVRVKLTRKARSIIEKIESRRNKMFVKILEKISERDRTTLITIIERIAEAVKHGQ